MALLAKRAKLDVKDNRDTRRSMAMGAGAAASGEAAFVAARRRGGPQGRHGVGAS